MTSKQIIKGAAMWIDSELLSTMHGIPKYGIGIGAALLSKRGEALLEKVKNNEKVKALGIIQGGEFDYDLLREILVEPFPADGIRVEAAQINGAINRFLGKLAPILNYQVQGGITFHKSDVEKLFDFFREA